MTADERKVEAFAAKSAGDQLISYTCLSSDMESGRYRSSQGERLDIASMRRLTRQGSMFTFTESLTSRKENEISSVIRLFVDVCGGERCG